MQGVYFQHFVLTYFYKSLTQNHIKSASSTLGLTDKIDVLNEISVSKIEIILVESQKIINFICKKEILGDL